MEPEGLRFPPDRTRAFGVASSACKARSIVVCDDERHIVRLIQVNLERQGCEVRTAYDGFTCLEMIFQQRPGLLVLDAEMPGMSGYEVLRRLREDPATEDLPVILLEAKASPNDANGPPPPPFLGASTTLRKPFNPAKILSSFGSI